jgi:hypothetical protein
VLPGSAAAAARCVGLVEYEVDERLAGRRIHLAQHFGGDLNELALELAGISVGESVGDRGLKRLALECDYFLPRWLRAHDRRSPDRDQRIRFAGCDFFSALCDVRGAPVDLVEVFHDEGQNNIAECMRAYADVGFSGTMCPDHVPTMEGESNSRPAYGTLGRLFAIGCIRGLLRVSLRR